MRPLYTNAYLLLQSTLRISPPLPYLTSNVQKDLLRLGSRLDPQDTSSPLTPPSSASPSSLAISRRWRGGSSWPGADVLDQPEDAFSIEREARLHRQAAGSRYSLIILKLLRMTNPQTLSVLFSTQL